MAHHAPAATWKSVISKLIALGSDAELRVPTEHIDHPLDAGMMKLDAGPDNEYFDYACRLQPRLWCRARQYADFYVARLIVLSPEEVGMSMQKAPACAVARQPEASLANMLAESPGWTLLLASALGAAAGAVAGGGKGAAVGALIGSGIGLATVGVSTAAGAPATAQAAQTMFLGLSATALAGQTARQTAAFSLPPQPAFMGVGATKQSPTKRRSSSNK